MNMSTYDLTLSHEFDAAAAREMEGMFQQLSETQQGSIRIDMQQVQFIDSCGIGAIVFLYKRLKSHGSELYLEGVNGQPLELMRMLRIDKVIPCLNEAANQ
ncbi:hypothetical protein VST7929_02445 [Vibrio stylophorae]|uniref:STAS domain-containing protein n=1 Tax=Vibrio stylophorae TaxID=659351 RepID=A0ABM8ZW00_9VIBR|nr:STAS domain-containing protein [Vibrio stylophorae]CAH0534502.1 hypothetical protein VST7929_02445 [Vibrio stylophorae]